MYVVLTKSYCTHVQNPGLGDDCDWYSIGIVIVLLLTQPTTQTEKPQISIMNRNFLITGGARGIGRAICE